MRVIVVRTKTNTNARTESLHRWSSVTTGFIYEGNSALNPAAAGLAIHIRLLRVSVLASKKGTDEIKEKRKEERVPQG